jgi:glyoxylase I family protein
MIRIMEYHHVGLVVRNLEKCQWFYGQILGLRAIPRPAFSFPGEWYRIGPGTQLHLMVLEETIPQTMRHFALEVLDFANTVQELGKMKVDIVEGPGKRPDGSDYLFCKDPDGNLIEITHH